VEDEIDDYPELFSQQTREALGLSVDALVDGLQRHAKLLSGMRGGSSEMPAVDEANDQVERLIAAWNERVDDHTGTSPVSLQGFDDEDDEEILEGEEAAELVDGEPLTVVSRWDLQVVDTDELMQAGREAHKRLWPGENDEDAAVAVPNTSQAVYALLHEHGEPWYDLPGIEVVRGARAYVRPIDPPTPLSPEDDLGEAIAQPPGEQLFNEGWA
jgi:hypothetical protein